MAGDMQNWVQQMYEDGFIPFQRKICAEGDGTILDVDESVLQQYGATATTLHEYLENLSSDAKEEIAEFSRYAEEHGLSQAWNEFGVSPSNMGTAQAYLLQNDPDYAREFFGLDQTDGRAGDSIDAGQYCRLTMQRVIEETLDPSPIPEGNTLIKQPNILDFYDHLNQNHFGGVAPDAESGFRNLYSFLEPQMNVPYGISVQKPNGETYIFDTAEAADMGATMVTLNILRHMQENDLDTVPPIEALAGIDRTAAEDTYERCIEAANEIAASQTIPVGHDLSMDACYTAGTQLAAFVANDVAEREVVDASSTIPRPQLAISR